MVFRHLGVVGRAACVAAALTATAVASDRPQPALSPTFVALVAAGGGGAKFKTLTLLRRVAGAEVNLRVAALTRRFGAAEVKLAILTSDAIVNDALRLAALPGAPAPAEPGDTDGGALYRALLAAGTSRRGGSFDTGAMLDRLLTPALHVQVADDVERRLGSRAAVAYREVFGRFMRDLPVRA